MLRLGSPGFAGRVLIGPEGGVGMDEWFDKLSLCVAFLRGCTVFKRMFRATLREMYM
jgi:hypothetical protein